MEAFVPVIKRYANRKLYDTSARRYIALDGIAGLIRQGREVTVIDHETGADITPQIQAQIIFEEEKRLRGSLPGAVLTGLIRTGSDTLAHLRQAIAPNAADWHAQVDAEIERRLGLLAEAGILPPDEAQRLAALLATARDLGSAADLPTPAELRQALADRGLPARAELNRLARELEALSAEVDRLTRARRARGR
jgi:polyhydroxyalkanoate synthesis repressor PhaR